VKLQYDAKTDALYVRLADVPVAESQELHPGVILDYDDQGRVVGVEILNVKRQLPNADVTTMQLDLAS